MKTYKHFFKLHCFGLLAIPMVSFANWNLTINNIGGSPADYQALLPFNYSSNTCLFDFEVLANGVEALIISNTNQCQNNAYLLLDGYKYALVDPFEVTYDELAVDIPNGLNLNNCHTISGNSINNSSPHLHVNLISFQLDDNFDHHVKHIDDETHFVFETTNHDVVCDNGIAIDLIYSGGFE